MSSEKPYVLAVVPHNLDDGQEHALWPEPCPCGAEAVYPALLVPRVDSEVVRPSGVREEWGKLIRAIAREEYEPGLLPWMGEHAPELDEKMRQCEKVVERMARAGTTWRGFRIVIAEYVGALREGARRRHLEDIADLLL